MNTNALQVVHKLRKAHLLSTMLEKEREGGRNGRQREREREREREMCHMLTTRVNQTTKIKVHQGTLYTVSVCNMHIVHAHVHVYGVHVCKHHIYVHAYTYMHMYTTIYPGPAPPRTVTYIRM